MNFCLTLQRGICWHIRAGDDAAALVVARLAEVMQLPVSRGPLRPGVRQDVERRVVVVLDGHEAAPMSADEVVCRLTPAPRGLNERFWSQLELSLQLARVFLLDGGLLLHGALVQRHGRRLLLSGHSGVGKTTASQRLPAPWQVLCDDASLVVPDTAGQWWAHPWPTWSRIIEGDLSASWDVPSAAPLSAIFYLKQAARDTATPIGAGHLAAQLAQASEEVAHLMTRGLTAEQVRRLRLQRFDWLCALARAVPAFTLEISLTGAFWDVIEQTLGWNTSAG